MKNNRILIILISVIASIVVARTFYQNIRMPSANSIQPQLLEQFNVAAYNANSCQEDYQASLQTQEIALWNEITKVTGLTKEHRDSLIHAPTWQKKYQVAVKGMIADGADATAISKDNYELAKNILTLCGINTEIVTIVAWNGISPAASTDTALFINQELFDPLAPEIKKFILAHESCHINNHDHSTGCLLLDIQEKDNSPQLVNLINKFSFFIELRADIHASLRGLEFAQGHILFAQHELQELGNKEYPDYPSNAERLALGEKIITLYNIK